MIIIGAFRSAQYVGAGFFILSLCVVFAGFANHAMKISFNDMSSPAKMDEKATMIWPQYILLSTSLVLCFWMPDTLYQTINNAVTFMGGGF